MGAQTCCDSSANEAAGEILDQTSSLQSNADPKAGEAPVEDTFARSQEADEAPAPPEKVAEKEEGRHIGEGSEFRPMSDVVKPQLKKKVQEEIRIEFLIQGNERKEVCFPKGPLGLSFSRTVPAKITAVQPGGIGEKMEVKVDWDIMAIDGEDVSKMDAASIQAKFFPKGRRSIDIEFMSKKEERITVSFTHRPLRLSLKPSKVQVVYAIEEECVAYLSGVRKNWAVTKLDGNDISKRNWTEVTKEIASMAKELPSEIATPGG
mmetsp:Transcript_115303/g.182104  ORF Transcript_115303/g.182104 Transcript_115303/m.182104 type:complete len:263 (+) Transcript_115303:65-853(+)|eukprot:CAMPEP_0169191610 /NCGR_PEP_ID=MMETSP1016-20121227/5166_1 /TAXON_ID=342587 /ORGANISM="Karlodinium micrum, Strain CCMP2283" /LENGTH=262 /DNA_ID=CAMNT_0009267881 /DNA_START=36 /DNA_END=824 /DNA_ORIENTATION=-